MSCVQCFQCKSSQVVPSRWRVTLADFCTAITLRRPYRCTSCLNRFSSFQSALHLPHTSHRKTRSALASHMATTGLALVMALFTSQKSRADIVYTTAASQGTNSSTTASTPSTSSGYLIGTFANATTSPSFSFTTNQSPGIQFTTSTFTDTNALKGVNINLFVKGTNGSNGTNTINGTLHWGLYKIDNTTASNVASFTSTLNPMAYTGSGLSANNYQNTPFNVVTGSDTLFSNTQYTLLLQSIDGITTSNKTADLYWNYFNTGNTPSGGNYSVQHAGYVTGPYTGANTFTNQNFAFDINVASAPEPGTMLLGLIASSVGGGVVWWKRRKKPADQVADENVLPA